MTTVAEIDQLKEEQALQIKGIEVKLSSRKLQSDKSEYSSENLNQEIAEVQAIVSTSRSPKSPDFGVSLKVTNKKNHANKAISSDLHTSACELPK